MPRKTKLPLMVLGRRMIGTPPTETDAKITFEIEAETGEIFEISFTQRGLASTVTMALNWPPLKEALADVKPPIKF
ncbi:hypothetical protein ACVI1J_002288 [Bradyrhizobium diazoefficiens]